MFYHYYDYKRVFSVTTAFENGWIYAGSAKINPVFKPGDVLELPFPFTDLSGFKTRPALVLARSKTDLIVAFLSTHITWAAWEDMILKPSPENGLSSLSLLRTGKLFSIAPQLVYRKIGELSSAELQAALWCLKACFSGDCWPDSSGITDWSENNPSSFASDAAGLYLLHHDHDPDK